MDRQKIQSITRIAGVSLLFIVIIAQLFKSQTFIPQAYLPYLSLLSLILLSISLYLKAKAGGFSQYNLPIKMILIFIIVVVGGVYLIYRFTT
jgi:hypothetical protein